MVCLSLIISLWSPVLTVPLFISILKQVFFRSSSLYSWTQWCWEEYPAAAAHWEDKSCKYEEKSTCMYSWVFFLFSRHVFIELWHLTIHLSQSLITFTQPRNTTAVVRQFSTDNDSHRAKHRWRKDKPLCDSHRKPALQLLKRRDGTLHDADVCVYKMFPRCPPVNLNPFMHNYIIAISKLEAVWLCHSRLRRLFSKRKFTEVSVWKADHCSDFFFFIINTWWVEFCCQWQTLIFGQKCDQESVGQVGGQTLLHVELRYFFLHISCQRQLQLLRYLSLVL